MFKTLKIAATFLALAVSAASAQGMDLNCGNNEVPFGGCVTPGQGGSNYKTQVYMGLQFAFGNGAVPKLVVGARRTKASGRKVYGADANVRIGFQNGVKLDSSVLSLVGGRSDSLVNTGIGYSFAEKSVMITGAFEKAHVRGGVDYVFSLSAPTYFIEANTIKQHEGVGALRLKT
jgi:hypothetical protein